MTTDYNEDSQELAATSQAEQLDVSEMDQQEAPESTNDQEEELYFWSEPGVCG